MMFHNFIYQYRINRTVRYQFNETITKCKYMQERHLIDQLKKMNENQKKIWWPQFSTLMMDCNLTPISITKERSVWGGKLQTDDFLLFCTFRYFVYLPFNAWNQLSFWQMVCDDMLLWYILSLITSGFAAGS